MRTVVTYWQVYLILAGCALAAFWCGWAACLLANPGLASKHRRARARARAAAELEQAPAPLPELPAAAAAVIDARHANAMAATRPREAGPLARGRAHVAAVYAALNRAAAARQAWEADRPWGDDTGTFTALIDAQDREQEQAA